MEDNDKEKNKKEEIWRRESRRERQREREEKQTGRRKDRQLGDRGEVQPIRDEMELLESERRILSPGCCTEEREKGGEGGRSWTRERRGRGGGGGREEEEGRKRERTEDHAPCNTTVLYLRKNEKN